MVGATSTWLVGRVSTPAVTPGPRSSIGTSTSVGVKLAVCPQKPCSKNSSPWSPVITTSVSSSAPESARAVIISRRLWSTS